MKFLIVEGVALTENYKKIDRDDLKEDGKEHISEELIFLLDVYEGVQVTD